MKNIYVAYCLTFAFLLTQCSIPEVRQVKFQRDGNAVIQDLKNLAGFQNAVVNLAANSINGKQRIALPYLYNMESKYPKMK